MPGMLKKRYFVMAAVAVVVVAAGVISLMGKDLALAGTYRTYLSETYDEEDGMTCAVRISSREHLGLGGVEVGMGVGLTFHFGGPLEFEDVGLSYKVTLGGDWGVTGDELTMTPDTASFNCIFSGSTARNNVEEAMVRQLRKFVAVSIVPKIRRRVIEANSHEMRIWQVTHGGVVGEVNGRTVVLLKE